MASESIDVSDGVRWETRSEYYRKNPKAFAVVIAITVFGPFLGLFLAGWLGVMAGLVLGGIAYWISPLASTRIIEITRG